MDYSGKKILILGANAETIPIIKIAQNMGIHVTVTDNIPRSPAKTVADEYLDIDGKDVDLLARIIKERGIDGVMVGVADSLVPSYYSLCKKVNLPCYAGEYSSTFFSDKIEWKNYCSSHGIPTLRRFYEGNTYSVELRELPMPVVIKPQISRGGKGVSICGSPEDVQEAFEKACSISENSKCVIEEYCEGDRLSAYYLVVDGSAVLLNLADCNWLSVPETNNRFLVYSFSSKLLEAYTKNMGDRITGLLCDNGIQNGIVTIEMFYDKGEFHVFDLEFNVTGAISSERLYRYIFRGYNAVEALVGYSICGKIILERDWDIAKKYRSSALIYIYVKEGTVGDGRVDIEGCDARAIYEVQQRLYPGNCVLPDQVLTTKGIVARIWLADTCSQRIVELVNNVIAGISIKDNNGQNMII